MKEMRERRTDSKGVQGNGEKVRGRLVTESFSATFKWILCKLLQTPRENVNSLHLQQLIKVDGNVIKQFKTLAKGNDSSFKTNQSSCAMFRPSVAWAEIFPLELMD